MEVHTDLPFTNECKSNIASAANYLAFQRGLTPAKNEKKLILFLRRERLICDANLLTFFTSFDYLKTNKVAREDKKEPY